MSEWTPVDIPMRDFDLDVGMLIEVQDGEEVVSYLIGDMTTDTSTCCGCNDTYDTRIVLRYRSVL